MKCEFPAILLLKIANNAHFKTSGSTYFKAFGCKVWIGFKTCIAWLFIFIYDTECPWDRDRRKYSNVTSTISFRLLEARSNGLTQPIESQKVNHLQRESGLSYFLLFPLTKRLYFHTSSEILIVSDCNGSTSSQVTSTTTSTSKTWKILRNKCAVFNPPICMWRKTFIYNSKIVIAAKLPWSYKISRTRRVTRLERATRQYIVAQ